MSVACHEDRCLLRINKEAFAVTSEKIRGFTAICDEHIPQIENGLRLDEPAKERIDIHFLFSTPSGTGAWFGEEVDTLSLTRMELGDYRFSISRELARVILPRSLDFILRLERDSQNT